MKLPSMYKSLQTAGAVTILALGVSSQASGQGIYQVTPSVFGGPATPFEANFVNGNSSSLLALNGGGQTISGAGWVDFTSFQLNNVAIAPGETGLDVNYEMWAQYSYTMQLVSGAYGQSNSNYYVTALHVELFAAPGLGTSFIPADATSNGAATVSPAGGFQLLGSGDLLNGVMAFNFGGGGAFNSSTDFALTAFGSTFFTAPVPFHDLSFNAFNHTIQGVERLGDQVAINQATAGFDFASTIPEPEPYIMLLAGLGLLGWRFQRPKK